MNDSLGRELHINDICVYISYGTTYKHLARVIEFTPKMVRINYERYNLHIRNQAVYEAAVGPNNLIKLSTTELGDQINILMNGVYDEG